MLGIEQQIEQQIERALSVFERRFGRPASAGAVAPGRVNLLGEHTDYNGGFVLPAAIERQTVVVADASGGSGVTLVSAAQPDEAVFELSAELRPGEPGWANYVKGVLAGAIGRGATVPGFDAVIDTTVPLGGGLSSSASLEVATATLLEVLAGWKLDPVERALLCQEAEHRFTGMPCGVMDQMISSLGRAGAALLIDCRSHEADAVELADGSVVVVIADTKVKHELVSGGYAQRRAECERAAAGLGVKLLREADAALLSERGGSLGEAERRRARHVVSENQRTLEAAEALRAGDWARMGRLMAAGHASLRDDFEVSCAEVDAMVGVAESIGASGGVYGARMTGGGFGGCVVALVRAEAAGEVQQRLAAGYREATGIEPAVFATRPAAGARVISVK